VDNGRCRAAQRRDFAAGGRSNDAGGIGPDRGSRNGEFIGRNPQYAWQIPYWRNWTQTFDYLLWMDFGNARQPRPGRLQLVASGSFFEINKIAHP